MQTQLQQEIAALRRIASHDEYLVLRGSAYGYGGDSLRPDSGYDYEITIHPEENRLCLIVDGYAALGLPQDLPFDDERWESMRVYLYEPADRVGYRNLAAAARVLVSGKALAMPGGVRIKLSWLLATPRKDAPWYAED